jgi:uncharacterized delta-60 repeat protein
MVTVPGFTGITLIYNFAVLGNGDFVVAGGNRESVKYNGFMSKFNAAGELVTSFGTNGHFIQDGGGNIYNQAKDIVASNDKLIVGYGYGPATNYDYEVSRYDFNGVPDTDFGTNGNVIFNLGNASVHDYLHAVVLQPDGKIIAGGTGYTGGFTLVRLLQEVPELGLGAVILKDNSLTVYPNPVTANSKLQLTLKNDASITLNLYDVSGTLIKTLAQNTPIAAGTTNLDIKLPELSAGVYLLSVSGNGINQTVKIIK